MFLLFTFAYKSFSMRIVFFIIVFTVIVLMAGYVALRGGQVLSGIGSLKWWYLGLNIVSFVAMMAGLILAEELPQQIAKPLAFWGYTYMITFIYLLLSFTVIDIISGFNAFLHFLPYPASFKLWAFVASLVIIAGMLVYGNYQFNHPDVVRLFVKSSKPLQNKHLKIVAISDLHLGVAIDKKQLEKYIEMINAEHPDVVLMAGDVSDRTVKPMIRQHMDEDLAKINAPLGVYAISGNHEYYSGDPYGVQKYITKAGIIYLRDSVVQVADAFYIAGRDDRTNPHRKKIGQILAGTDPTKPIILMDHQPQHLEEAVINNVDLQISGHTHNGQFFPGNLMVKLMYEKGYGYLKKGKSHFYVSSGLGIWGPLYRIGTQSELVVINLKY